MSVLRLTFIIRFGISILLVGCWIRKAANRSRSVLAFFVQCVGITDEQRGVVC